MYRPHGRYRYTGGVVSDFLYFLKLLIYLLNQFYIELASGIGDSYICAT